MKLFKRCVIFLVIALLVPTYCFAIPSDLWVDDGSYGEIYGEGNKIVQESDILSELLYKLSILPSEKYDFNEKAERETFINAVAHIAGFVPGKDTLGILEEGSFVFKDNSDRYVSFDEAIYSAIKLTGYTQYAEINGGSAYDYYMLAEDKDLLYNINYRSGDFMTYGELIQFLYNTLIIDTNEIKSINDDGYKLEKGEPLLKSRFSVELKKGILTGVYNTGLYPDEELGEYQASIDRVVYETENTDIKKYVGMAVNAFIQNDDARSDFILVVYPDMSECTVNTFEAKDVWEQNDRILKINSEDKTKNLKIKIAENARVIYNGVYAGNLTDDALREYLEKDTHITTIDNNRDNSCEVLIIWEYEDFILKSDAGITSRMKFLYDLSYMGNKSVLLDDNETITEIYINGVKSTPEKLKKGMAVSLASGKNKVGRKYLRVEASDRKFTGTVNEASFRDGTFVVVADNEKYSVTDNYARIGANPSVNQLNSEVTVIRTGHIYEFNLTFNGKIANATEKSSKNLYGCMISFSITEEFDTEIMLKIFTQEGEFERLPLAEKVILHDSLSLQGERLKKENIPQRIENCKNTTDPRIMIQFSKNKDGLINELYLPVDNIVNGPGTMDYPLSLDYTHEGLERYYHGMLSMTFRALPQLKLFMIPPVEKQSVEKEYRVIAVDSFGIDHYYSDMTLYGVDEFSIPCVAVTKASGERFDNTASVIVDSVSQVINKDEEEVCLVKFYADGALSEYYTDESDLISSTQDGWYENINIKDLKRGDVIHFEINMQGAITRFRVLFRPGNPLEYRIKDDYGKTLMKRIEPLGFGIIYGKAVGVKKDVLKFDFENDEIYNQPVRLYDKAYYYLVEDNSIKRVSIDDIEPGDDVVARYGWQGALEVYLYRK